MLERTLSFIMTQFLQCCQKCGSENDDPVFQLTPSRLPLACYSQSRYLAVIFSERNRIFHRMCGRMCKRGIR